MEQILGPLQKMYLILCLAEGMRDRCAGKEELKADYQIHSRIYANAFASMIRYGAQPDCESRNGVAFLTVSLEGHTYSCPARTVKNIMKAEFASVGENLPVLADMVQEEEAKAAAEMKVDKKRKRQERPRETVVKPIAQTESVSQGQKTQIEASVQKESVLAETPAKPRSVPVETTDQTKIVSVIQLEPRGNGSQVIPVATGVFKSQGQKTVEVGQAAPVFVLDDGPSHATSSHAEKSVSRPMGESASSSSMDPVEEPVCDTAINDSHGDRGVVSHETLPDLTLGSLPPVPEEGRQLISAGAKAKETCRNEQSDLVREKTGASGGSTDVWKPVPRCIEGQMPALLADREYPPIKPAESDLGTPGDESSTQDHADNEDGDGPHEKTATSYAFQRKQKLQEPPVEDGDSVQEANAKVPSIHPGKYVEMAGKSPLRVLSRFLPKGKKQDVMGVIQTPPPVQNDVGATPDEIPHVSEEERGEQICHTHCVMLRKTYGTQVTGPYVIQVWPIEVIEMCPNRMPSAIFVRAQAPNGTVICKVNEGRTKYIVLDIDNKQFNVFGYWEYGKFITEVSTISKTASIYTMSEEVEQECPEHVSDPFLDQFRSREPHRPEFFVVPVSNNIPESGTVPIAAFIRVKDKSYPVTSKGPRNTLRFTYESQLSEISGWWKDGRFTFLVQVVGEE